MSNDPQQQKAPVPMSFPEWWEARAFGTNTEAFYCKDEFEDAHASGWGEGYSIGVAIESGLRERLVAAMRRAKEAESILKAMRAYFAAERELRAYEDFAIANGVTPEKHDQLFKASEAALTKAMEIDAALAALESVGRGEPATDSVNPKG